MKNTKVSFQNGFFEGHVGEFVDLIEGPIDKNF